MKKRIISFLQRLFKQPKIYKLKVLRLDGLDLSKYHNSLHYFFEEIFWLDQTEKFSSFRSKLAYIGTGKTEDIIIAAFDESTTTIEEIIKELIKIGIYTKIML